MTWLEDMSLRDLPESTIIETTCLRCLHTWRHNPTLLLLKVIHRDVKLDEVAKSLACPRPGCRHVGVRLALVRADDVTSFVGGMP